MARTRNLKPGFFKNERLAELPYETRLLFAGLWTIADRSGRLEDRPKRIHAELFPYDHELDLEVMLEQLDQSDFIFRYKINNSAYIQIPKWFSHQNPHPKETVSVTSPIPVDLADFKACRDFSRQSRDISRPDPSSSLFLPAPNLPSLNVQQTAGLFGADTTNRKDPGQKTDLSGAPKNSKLAPVYAEVDAWFENELWPLMWRKTAKKAARDAARKTAINPEIRKNILRRAKREAPVFLQREVEHRPHPATWLNREDFTVDEQDPAQIGPQNKISKLMERV